MYICYCMYMNIYVYDECVNVHNKKVVFATHRLDRPFQLHVEVHIHSAKLK